VAVSTRFRPLVFARYRARSALRTKSSIVALDGSAVALTPTLIVTDAGDQRVPTPLSYEFYHAVRSTGTPVELLVYPVNGHFPGDPLHAEDVNRRWVDWFAKHF